MFAPPLIHRAQTFAILLVLAALGSFSDDADADDTKQIQTQWVEDLLSVPTPDGRRVVKWSGNVSVTIYYEKINEPGPLHLSLDSVESITQLFETEFEQSSGRILDLSIVPFSHQLVPSVPDGGIAIYLTTLSSYSAIAQYLEATNDPRARTFTRMLFEASSAGILPYDPSCIFTYAIYDTNYLGGVYAIVDTNNFVIHSLRCLSRHLLAGVGIGSTEDNSAPSILAALAPDSKIFKPTEFDYRMVTLLYDDGLRPSLLSDPDSQREFTRIVEEFMSGDGADVSP